MDVLPRTESRRVAALCLPATLENAHRVRACCARLLAAWGVPAGDALVVLAELLANAAEHGGEEMAVRLCHRADRLEVEVVDTGSSGRPLPAVPGPAARGGVEAWGDVEGLRGRGLPMVSVLSESFVLRRGSDGSTRALALVRTGAARRIPSPDRGLTLVGA